MTNKAVYIKIFGDSIIPLLGFFLWNWSLYFIVLFYILDLLLREVLVHLKTKKIKNYSQKVIQKKWMINGTVGTILLVFLLAGIHLIFTIIHPSINFWQEITAFLGYEEMGIQQAYVLIPLVIFMGYTTYLNEFLRPRLFALIDFETLWKGHFTSSLLIIALVLICGLLSVLFQLPEWVYLTLILASTIGYGFYNLRNEQQNKRY